MLLPKSTLAAFVSAFCFLCGPATAQTFTFNGTVEVSDPDQVGRLLRDGVPSVAGTQKPFPGINDLNQRDFDSFSFTNTAAISVPVFVDLFTADSRFLVFASAYLGSFNPSNIAQNYLADAGFSPVLIDTPFSFDVPAGATFWVNVNNITPGQQAGYTLTVTGAVRPDALAAPGPIAGAGLPALFGLLGAWYIRRRRQPQPAI
jgi:hypothetical protein